MSNPSQSSQKGDEATRALDTKHTGFGSNGGCAETDKTHDHQWWKAEFNDTYVITSLKILPRFDCCRDRSTNVTVSTSLDGITWTLCADLGDRLSTVTPDGSWVVAVCPKYTFGKFVKIILYNKQFFALCEVEAFGYK